MYYIQFVNILKIKKREKGKRKKGKKDDLFAEDDVGEEGVS